MSNYITIVFDDTQKRHQLEISDLSVLPISLGDKIQQISQQDSTHFLWTLKDAQQSYPLESTKSLYDQGVRYGSEIHLNSITSFFSQSQNEYFRKSGPQEPSPLKSQRFGDSYGPQIQQFGNQQFQQVDPSIPNINQNMQQNQNQFTNQQYNNQQNQYQFINPLFNNPTQQFNSPQQLNQPQPQPNTTLPQQFNTYQQGNPQFQNTQSGQQLNNQAQQLHLQQQINQPYPFVQPNIIPPQQFNPFMSTQPGQPGQFPIQPPFKNTLVHPNQAAYATNQNETKLKQQQIESLKNEVEEKSGIIEDLEKQNAKLKREIKQLLNDNGEKSNLFEEQQEKIEQKEKIIKDLKKQIQELNFENQTLQCEIQTKDSEISDLQAKIARQNFAYDSIRTIQNVGIDTNDLKNQIDDLRRKNQAQLNQLNNVQQQVYQKDQRIRELEEALYNYQYNQRSFYQRDDQNTQRQIQQLIEANKQLERKVEELNHRATVQEKIKEDREKQIRELKSKVEDEQNTNQLLLIEINSLSKMTEYLEGVAKQNAQGNFANNNNSVLANIQKFKQNQEEELNRKKAEGERQREIKRIEEQKMSEERNKIEEQRRKIQKEEKYKKAIKLRDAILNNQGVLQVGLLIDVTGSMDEYKDATMNVIERAMVCIKSQTNRDCEWGTVCYQDFSELKLEGEYKWLQFTKDNKQMMEYLKKIKCDGGDDGAEDLNGGIKQMIRQLRWDKYFKLALLICDAPSHGTKWAGKTLDYYPNENLEEGLQELINKNIVLIGIVFNAATDIMFEQMKNFYARQNKSNLLIIVPLKNLSPNQIQENLIQIISEASVVVTQVNQTGTKTKQQLKDVVRDGAFEALVKKLQDPSKFTDDPKIQTILTAFEVYKVEIKSDSFEQNINTIYKLKIPDDYVVQKESVWNCVRTLKPFAFGQLKEVYLMKKADQINSKEVYVIKMPIGGQTYKTMNEAILECRSHLISQQLMKKFIQDLTSKPLDQSIPQLRYSDFLILKEHETSFWIAERFFQGQFLKFNNNFGYINPEETLINKLAQAFSYYTFYISDLNYMVCDVQGVGTNFTDPAINTQEGGFDDTDQGQDGIAQYIVSLVGKKDQFRKYLNLLDIEL